VANVNIIYAYIHNFTIMHALSWCGMIYWRVTTWKRM